MIITPGKFFVYLSLVTISVFMVDPQNNYFGAESYIFLKYFPVAILYLSTIFFYNNIGFLFLNFRTFQLLAIYFTYILFGSLYTIFILNNSAGNSFLGRSLNLGIFFCSVLFFFKTHNHWNILNKFFLPILLCSSLMLIFLLLWLINFRFNIKLPHIYHEEIFLPISFGVSLLFTQKNFKAKIFFSFLFCSTGFLSWKLTGFLASLIGYLIISISIFILTSKKNKNIRFLRTFNTLYSLTFVFILFFLTVYIFSEYFPDGSTNVRLKTYSSRLSQFFINPYFGTFFIGSPIMELSYLNIPSHSDFLDLLSFGGIFSIFIFFSVIFIILSKSFYCIFLNQSFSFWYDAFSFSSVLIIFIEMLFNPILHQVPIAFIFWFNLGYLSFRLYHTKIISLSAIKFYQR